MKLWVDDIRNAPDDIWTVAKTVTSALRALYLFGDQVTEISLDHDISHQVTVGALGRPYPCEETFMAVAYYIVERWGGRVGNPLNPRIMIHTANQIAGEEMNRMFTENNIFSELMPMGVANRLEMEV